MEEEIIVSFDASSLFTNVPVDETLNAIEQRLNMDETLTDRTNLLMQSLIDLLRLCLTITCFEEIILFTE